MAKAPRTKGIKKKLLVVIFIDPDVFVLEAVGPLEVLLAPAVWEPLALELELPELEGLLTTVTVVRVVHWAWLLTEASSC